MEETKPKKVRKPRTKKETKKEEKKEEKKDYVVEVKSVDEEDTNMDYKSNNYHKRPKKKEEQCK
jgi:hypothetical protein